MPMNVRWYHKLIVIDLRYLSLRRKGVETSGLFIQRLRDFRKIRDLQESTDFKKNRSTADNGLCTSLGSLVSEQKQTHARLIAMVAMSYWRCEKNPIKIVMSYGRSVKNSTITDASTVSAIR